MKFVGYAWLSIFLTAIYMGCGEPGPEKAAPSAETSRAGDDWKLGMQMWTFRMHSFSEAVDKMDSAGVRYIEAFFGQPLGGSMKDTFGLDMSADSREQLKKLLLLKNMHIVAMGVIVPADAAEWKKCFELAKEFDMSYISAEPHKDQLDAVDSLAGVYNIRVAIHDHPKPSAYWHPDSVIAAMQGHRHIGSCADIGHWARNGLNPTDCLKKLDGHVYGLHIKDIKKFDMVNTEDTVLGKGVIDFPALFSELQRQKFQGMISIEHESDWSNKLDDVKAIARYYHEQVSALNAK